VRIAICNWKDLAHPARGGAEVFVHEVGRRWVDQGHQVRLLCAAVDGRPDAESVDGIEVRRRGTRFGVYRSVRQELADSTAAWADVLIDSINTRPFLDPGRAGAPVLGLAYQVCREIWFDEMPFVVAVGGRYVLEPRWLRAYRGTTVATISSSSRASLLGYGLDDVRVVTIGASVVDPGPVAKASLPTAVFVGRLASNKGPQHALAAFARARVEVPDAELIVVGDGPLGPSLRSADPPGVRFVGRLDEVQKARVVKASDVIVVPSRREGWGLVVTEAAALGTPSVAFDVPGLRDSVLASRMGSLVAPNVQALASGLVLALGRRERPSPTPPPKWDTTARELIALLDERAGASRT